MPVLTFNTDPGLNAPNIQHGDAHVGSAGTPNVFNADQAHGWIGRNVKNAPEVNVFTRFDTIGLLPGIPVGSRINGVNARFQTSHVAVSSGSFHLGTLFPYDGVWDVRGYKNVVTVPPEVDYNLAYEFTIGNNDAPQHPTKNSATTVEQGRIAFNAFTGGPYSWTVAAFPADRLFTIGDGIGGEDFSAPLTFVVDLQLNHFAGAIVGLVLDSNNVGAGPTRLRLWLTPAAGHPGFPLRRPALIIDYDLNYPAFTSSPVTTGAEGVAYSYDVNADPYDTLGDQTNNNFVDLLFGLTTFPTGMTINTASGQIDWTPAVGQAGNRDVVVTVENEGGLAALVPQAFTILLPPVFTNVETSAIAIQGEPFSFQTTYTNPIGLEFSLDSGPTGASMDVGGRLIWPRAETAAHAPGLYPVVIRATYTDGDTQTFNFTIDLKVSTAPIVIPGETAIANAALILLGERTIESLEANSPSARLVKDRYAEVRDDLLRVLPWNFATTRVELAASATPPTHQYARAYPVPSDFIWLLEVEDENRWGYVVEGQEILTSITAPLRIVYVRRVTNPTEMDPMFRFTLAASLAVDLAEAVTGDSGKLDLVLAIFQSRLDASRTSNGQEEDPVERMDASDWTWPRGREN